MESRTGAAPLESARAGVTPPHGDALTRPEPGETEGLWAWRGAVAGATGAAAVALFFLAIDWMAGRPLWTPTALGSQLLLGETHAADAGFDPILVIAYTLVHGLVFVGLGLVAAIEAERLRQEGATAIFLAVEVFFLGVTGVFAPGLVATVGAGEVALANALAAAAMAATLVLLRERSRGVREPT